MGSAWRVLAGLGLGVSLAACAHRAPAATAGPNAATFVDVDNQGWIDMDVYAISHGQRVRLGTAIGAKQTRFKIPSYLIATLTPLRFLADPIGGRRSPVSEEITVSPGDVIKLTIPPNP